MEHTRQGVENGRGGTSMRFFLLFGKERRYTWWMQRIQDLGDHPQQAEIKRRLDAIWLYEEHGLEAAKKIFNVSRSTLFSWKKRLRESGGRIDSLAPASRRPKRVRPPQTDRRIEEYVRQYRLRHPGVGKSAIKYELDVYCQTKGLPTVSESSVGRVLGRLKAQGKLAGKGLHLVVGINGGRLAEKKQHRPHRKLRRGDYRPKKAGDLVQIDSVAIFQDKLKRYLLTAIDVVTRFAFAFGYTSLSSKTGADFLDKLVEVCPFTISHIQTDNGQEFAKHFIACRDGKRLTHFYSYPRHPQSNGHVERFNRTVREQFLAHNDDDLSTLRPFNDNLMEYLLWYNTQKPHRSLGNLPPLKYYLLSSGLPNPQSNMYWTPTSGTLKLQGLI